MNKSLDGKRVRAIREIRGLTQEKLRKLANISKESIYRIEKGEQPGTRLTTRDALAKALDVQPGVLTGELPMPFGERAVAPDDVLFQMYPLSHKVDGAVRNAFTLVAQRYSIPMARIIELAPALFVLAAEGSLKQRQKRLVELQEMFDRVDDRRSNFLHLPLEIAPTFRADNAFVAEEGSIDQKDILAATLPDSIFNTRRVQKDYDEDEHNPFVTFLKFEAVQFHDDVIVERFSRSDTTFNVCRQDALKLTGGDEDLADYIIRGCVVLSKMPREFWSNNEVEARISWLRNEQEAYVALIPPLDDLWIAEISDGDQP